MNAKELREKSVSDLEQQLLDLRKEQFSLRMQHKTKQLKEFHRLRLVRKAIARVKTLIGEKKRVGEQS